MTQDKDSLDPETFVNRLKQSYTTYQKDPEALDTQGWMDDNVSAIFDYVDNPRIVIEVGSWKGMSAIALAERMSKTSTLICIDTWLGAPEFWTWGFEGSERDLKFVHGYPSVYYTFINNVLCKGLESIIAPFPISSIQGAAVLKAYKIRADAIYLDAAHEEDALSSDLESYWDILKPGGIMFGDDYADGWPGVCHAVDRFVRKKRATLEVRGKVWFINTSSGSKTAPVQSLKIAARKILRRSS